MRKLFICGYLAVALFFVKSGRRALDAFAQEASAPEIKLPLEPKSVRFAVIGDNGNGSRQQYEIAQQMDRFRRLYAYEFVIMLGDNIYGGDSPADFKQKFEIPYKPLLDAGIKFYAALGNHDNPNQRFYKLFNMEGKRYYSFKTGNVTFYALDSNYMDPEQLAWIESQLSGNGSDWKICYFHHPLYSDGRFHGPDPDLRARLEPIFERYGVNVVFSGHEHVYERIVPQHGIYYFVVGNSGELRSGNLRPSPKTAKGFDTDRTFALFEIAGDQLYFQAISRTGMTVDSGSVTRQATQKSRYIPQRSPLIKNGVNLVRGRANSTKNSDQANTLHVRNKATARAILLQRGSEYETFHVYRFAVCKYRRCPGDSAIFV